MILETKPPIVKPLSKNLYGQIGVYVWECQNNDCGEFNKWQTRQAIGYVTISCQYCKKVISLDKNLNP